MTVSVHHITKRFGAFTALDDVSLDARPGEFLALLGPSGSGKTTLLRVMAGLEFPDAGAVLFDHVDVTNARAAERRVGFVFQHYALFRHMTVAENIAFGLKVKKPVERPSPEAIAARVRDLLGLIQLEHLGGRYPSQLSGGQRQRVALARALAVGPRVLLLDEPFGALDAKVRKDLRRWLRQIHDETGVTSVFVTHDQEEALELADRVVVMNHGRIEQVGEPAEIYDHPASAFVADFIGEANRLEVTVRHGRVFFAGVDLGPADGHGDGPAILYARPHDFVITDVGAGAIPAVRRSHRRLGARHRILLSLGDSGATVEVETLGPLDDGDVCHLAIQRWDLFPA
ncbi:sulfate/molybdate ABC transporter ATP-binding protein [Parapedomonas caeni]